MDLSVLIPSRNEMFLNNTIRSVFENSEAETEIVVVLDGKWAVEPIPDPGNDRLTIVYHTESIGQRAATNLAARLARAPVLMKLDAHCSVGPGFDRILLEDMQPGWTMVPNMKNLHAFDWVCDSCGFRKDQGPTLESCPECDEDEMYREILWEPRKSPNSTAMRFDKEGLRFKYWGGYKKRQHGDLVDTMSILGACWMIEKERFFALNICDEEHGSWGQMGTEVACKTWLSGGRLVCDKRTWFAHMFRTQGGDFGFPYKLSGRQVNRARKYSRELWRADRPSEMPGWDGAIYPLEWLVQKFAPVPDWDEIKPLSKGIVYYTDNRVDSLVMSASQKTLKRTELPIVSVSLEPMEFGENIAVGGERGALTMFRQILVGLEAIDTDLVFLAEHDILYDRGHFDFVPPKGDVFYYNENCWQVDVGTGRALFFYAKRVSGLCAYRELLIEHYRKRVKMVEDGGFSRRMGFEPGTHNRKERVDNNTSEAWMSIRPNVDIRHGENFTATRWKKDEFRNQKFTRGWKEADGVPGWGQTKGRFKEILESIVTEV